MYIKNPSQTVVFLYCDCVRVWIWVYYEGPLSPLLVMYTHGDYSLYNYIDVFSNDYVHARQKPSMKTCEAGQHCQLFFFNAGAQSTRMQHTLRSDLEILPPSWQGECGSLFFLNVLLNLRPDGMQKSADSRITRSHTANARTYVA